MRADSDTDDGHPGCFGLTFEQKREVVWVRGQDQSGRGRQSLGGDDRVDHVRGRSLRLQFASPARDLLRGWQKGVDGLDDAIDWSTVPAAPMDLSQDWGRNDNDVALVQGPRECGACTRIAASQRKDPAGVQDQPPRPGESLYRGHSCPSTQACASAGIGPNSSPISSSSFSRRTR